jgi:hypothetical protein
VTSYPLVYAFLVLPLSIVHWIGFVQENHGDKQNHVPAGATIAVQAIYCLSGICNVLLFLLTRPNLLLFRKDVPEADRNENAKYIGGSQSVTISQSYLQIRLREHWTVPEASVYVLVEIKVSVALLRHSGSLLQFRNGN